MARARLLEGLIWRLSTEEEMDAMIEKIANLIIKYGLETPAILFFETIRPLSLMGGSLARVFVAPWFHLVGLNTRNVINTLEEPKNIEKLLKLIEERTAEEEKEKKKEKEKENKPKEGWRRILHL